VTLRTGDVRFSHDLDIELARPTPYFTPVLTVGLYFDTSSKFVSFSGDCILRSILLRHRLGTGGQDVGFSKPGDPGEFTTILEPITADSTFDGRSASVSSQWCY
jgi:hypothetical protein